jgi:hypothetical protein
MTIYQDLPFPTERKIGQITEGAPPIVCIFCGFITSIAFDLDLHLYENHRYILRQLPVRGRIDDRIGYAIMLGKLWLRN